MPYFVVSLDDVGKYGLEDGFNDIKQAQAHLNDGAEEDRLVVIKGELMPLRVTKTLLEEHTP